MHQERSRPPDRRSGGGCAGGAPSSPGTTIRSKRSITCLRPLGCIHPLFRDGRLSMSNNAAEHELRAVAVGRRNWTFAGSDEGGRRAAAIYTLIASAKLSDIDPQAWLSPATRSPSQAHSRTPALELDAASTSSCSLTKILNSIVVLPRWSAQQRRNLDGALLTTLRHAVT